MYALVLSSMSCCHCPLSLKFFALNMEHEGMNKRVMITAACYYVLGGFNDRKWSEEWFLKRPDLSHLRILEEFRRSPRHFREYLRMSTESYEDILGCVSPFITKMDTNMRRAVSPHEKLSSTLLYLATEPQRPE